MKKNSIGPIGNVDNISVVLRDDILFEIFRRLPVKSLLQFQLVCKHWQSLIKDPHFIHLHLLQSKTRPFLLIFRPMEDKNHYLSADLFEGGAVPDHRFTTPSKWLPRVAGVVKRIEALKPINSLICFVRMFQVGGAFIYNIHTRKESPWIESTIMEEEELDVELYMKSRYYPWYGFGFDPRTKEHKVVCIWDISRYTNSRRTECIRCDRVYEVFTVGQNTWRKINDVPPGKNLSGRESNYVNGVVAFDVGREKFRVIPIPDFILVQLHMDPLLNLVQLMGVDARLTLINIGCGGARMDEFKMWMFDDKQTTTTTSNNTHWSEETITMPFNWKQEDHCSFEALPGTDLIIIKPRKLIDNRILSLYYYDRKTKTSRKVEITAAEPLPINHYDFQLSVFFESLLPVQNQLLHKSTVEREQERERQRRKLPPEQRYWSIQKCPPPGFWVKSVPEN